MNEFLNIARKDYTSGKYKAAVEELREFLAANPGDTSGHIELAKNLLALGRCEEAIIECHCALGLDPQLAEPHVVLANAYLRQGRIEESGAEARKALRIEPNLAAAYGTLGLVALSQNRFQEAIDNFKKGASIEPNNSWYHVRLGIAYQMDRQHAAAIMEYRRVLEIDRSFEAAWRVVLGHITRHRWLFNSVIIGSMLMMFLVRSLLTVPIMVFWAAFTIGNIIFHFRMGRRGNGLVGSLLLLALTVFYVYNLLYGL
ncbi:MAG: tetratricopeptide repeat protein [Anaerolineae bacterium]|jgi:tetratricopeptide (TPR) repeat protein|nr:tetratricopeptide repeat protein [Anaerolineae bacterium]